jgi:hypothetical protein
MSHCAAGLEPAPNVVEFVYENHRGEVRAVRIDAATTHLWSGVTAYYPDHQPLLTAWDMDRGEERTYALKRVRSWGGV